MTYPTTTENGITLILPKPSTGNYTLTLTSFGKFPGQYPRFEPQYYGIEYSAHGGVARVGTSFRPKVFWQFEASLDRDQQETLKRMEAVYLNTPSAWTIYDYTNPHSEVGSASMALAPNSTLADDGDTVLYYPVWTAEPVDQGFEFREDPRNGINFVSFRLKEV